MASKIATYAFPNREAAEGAYNKIRDFMSEGIYRNGDEIEIYEDCPDPGRAALICVANGGRVRG